MNEFAQTAPRRHWFRRGTPFDEVVHFADDASHAWWVRREELPEVARRVEEHHLGHPTSRRLAALRAFGPPPTRARTDTREMRRGA